MDALRASYGDTSDTDSDSSSPTTFSISATEDTSSQPPTPLPPPPLLLLSPPISLGTVDYLQSSQAIRVRSFPHVEGNYALHVYIPVRIPSTPKRELAQFLKKVAFHVPGLHVVDVDVPVNILCKDDKKLDHVALGREFHISLGRTVPIRVHQIDSVVSMLRQKLQFQRCYWIDFNNWEVFVNDDRSRSFLSIEVIAGGLAEITRQIQLVNEVYKLHNLPEFYKDPRPHISVCWGLGDISTCLKGVVQEVMKGRGTATGLPQRYNVFCCKFNGIECKIGNKTYKICKLSEELKS